MTHNLLMVGLWAVGVAFIAMAWVVASMGLSAAKAAVDNFHRDVQAGWKALDDFAASRSALGE